jgi:hypothetical protein
VWSQLAARGLDTSSLEFTSDVRQIATGVPAGLPARSPFSVSASGVLAYWTNPLRALAVLSWFERDGRSAVALSTPTRYPGFALSPYGERPRSHLREVRAGVGRPSGPTSPRVERGRARQVDDAACRAQRPSYAHVAG